MKITPAIKAHLLRCTLYLLLAVYANPFALAQQNGKRSAANSKVTTTMKLAGAGAQSRALTSLVGATHKPAAGESLLPKAPRMVLYDQYDNLGVRSTFSDTFSGKTGYNAALADDFVVPDGQTWNVESIDADGSEGAGLVIDWNVFIYADNGGLPGTQVYRITYQPVSVSGTTFTVNLPHAAVLSAGTYWIEIQANTTFLDEGWSLD